MDRIIAYDSASSPVARLNILKDERSLQVRLGRRSGARP